MQEGSAWHAQGLGFEEKNISTHECDELPLESVSAQHLILSLTVNTRHFVRTAHFNGTVIQESDSIIITPFTDKQTEAERVLSNSTKQSQVTEEPRDESKSHTFTHWPLSFSPPKPIPEEKLRQRLGLRRTSR